MLYILLSAVPLTQALGTNNQVYSMLLIENWQKIVTLLNDSL